MREAKFNLKTIPVEMQIPTFTVCGKITTNDGTSQKNTRYKTCWIFFTPDVVANSIGEFSYSPEEGITFAAYFRRYEDIF